MTSPLCLLRHLASTRQMRLELSAAGAAREINTKNLLHAKVRMRKMMRVSLCHRGLTTWVSCDERRELKRHLFLEGAWWRLTQQEMQEDNGGLYEPELMRMAI